MKTSSRKGFTLIELLVVMVLFTTLAAMAVMVIPSINANRRASDAADRLQQWLLIARQRALRDQAPRGLRLIPNAAGTQVSELQFIETPDNYVPALGATLFVRKGAPPLPVSNPAYSPTTNVVTITRPITQFIREGDLIEFVTDRTVYRIAGPNVWPWNTAAPAGPHPSASIANATEFSVTTDIQQATSADLVLSDNFLFIRQPKPLLGEEPLKLPDGVVINLVPKGAPDVVPPNTTVESPPLDILFSPSGTVVTGNVYLKPDGTFQTVSATGKIVLLVEDTEGRGESTLLTIYTRNGMIAAHPPGPAGNFYQFTTDGKSSGL